MTREQMIDKAVRSATAFRRDAKGNVEFNYGYDDFAGWFPWSETSKYFLGWQYCPGLIGAIRDEIKSMQWDGFRSRWLSLEEIH